MGLLATLLLLATRLPLAPAHLFSFDTANFAWALDHFDPRLHQPQPPGYPLLVVEARLLRHIFGSPEQTFLACGLIAGILATVLLYWLGKLMFSPWSGFLAAMLLAVNPVFWRSTMTSPLRPYLAVVSVLVAICAWRAARGEIRFVFWGAAALGIGAGWRPATLVLLFPLWVVCSWRWLRPLSQRLLSLALLSLAVLAWLLPLTIASGGPLDFWSLLNRYLSAESSIGSPFYGSGFWGWWRQLAQGLVWYGLAVVGWFWAALLLASDKNGLHPLRRGGGGRRGLAPGTFLLVWIGPSVLFAFLIHLDAPGQTLAVIPALCLLGGAYLDAAARGLARWNPRWGVPRTACMCTALAINVAFFVFPFRNPLPHPPLSQTVPQALDRLRYWGAVALYRSSYGRVRAEEMRTVARLSFLRALGRNGMTVVWQDDDVSWRKISFYLDQRPIWVLQGYSGPPLVGQPAPRLWVGRQMVLERPGDSRRPLALPSSRVVWILHRFSPLPAELKSQGVPLRQFGTMFVSDLSSAPQRFHAASLFFLKPPRP